MTGAKEALWAADWGCIRGSAENGYNERFIGTLRKEILNVERFTTTEQAQIVITPSRRRAAFLPGNEWLRQYDHIRPHPALGMRP